MSTHPSTSVVLDRVSFAWPDGTPALHEVSGAFAPGRTGLIGRNGSGKSTLLHLIAGRLSPSAGAVIAPDDVALLPQRLTLDVDRPVSSLLGIDRTIAALRAIESGDADPAHFDVVGDDWDVEARAEAELAAAGLPAAALGRRIGTLSGGEAVLAALAGVRLRGAAVTLLDEPTNNLDRPARESLAELVRTWRGALIVVSHDTGLLELMDETAELYESSLTTFGGPYSQWESWLEAEQNAARSAEASAAQALRRERRDSVAAQTTVARRAQMGRKAQHEKRVPGIVAGNRASAAQVSAGRVRVEAARKVDEARHALDAAERRVRDDDSIRIDLPDPAVSSARRLAVLSDGERELVVQGPERIGLVGPNGAGKTTLLERLVANEPGATHGTRALTDRIGYLPQRVDGLDESRSAVENVAAGAPDVSTTEIRRRLARFLLRGDAALRPVATLSGGERFRVALARLLLAEPPVQLLVLDEPTNNLDLDTVGQLVDALRQYRGGLVVVSHDDAFLRRLDLTATWELDGGLRVL